MKPEKLVRAHGGRNTHEMYEFAALISHMEAPHDTLGAFPNDRTKTV